MYPSGGDFSLQDSILSFKGETNNQTNRKRTMSSDDGSVFSLNSGSFPDSGTNSKKRSFIDINSSSSSSSSSSSFSSSFSAQENGDYHQVQSQDFIDCDQFFSEFLKDDDDQSNLQSELFTQSVSSEETYENQVVIRSRDPTPPEPAELLVNAAMNENEIVVNNSPEVNLQDFYFIEKKTGDSKVTLVFKSKKLKKQFPYLQQYDSLLNSIQTQKEFSSKESGVISAEEQAKYYANNLFFPVIKLFENF
jgi:hypothetical protein